MLGGKQILLLQQKRHFYEKSSAALNIREKVRLFIFTSNSFSFIGDPFFYFFRTFVSFHFHSLLVHFDIERIPFWHLVTHKCAKLLTSSPRSWCNKVYLILFIWYQFDTYWINLKWIQSFIFNLMWFINEIILFLWG